MTHTTSEFGVEYDSLCDLVSFGLAPAVMAYFWSLTPDHLTALAPHHYRLGAAACFIFLACGALRLARFNVSSGVRDPGFFQGLPIPGGAVTVAGAVLWHHRAAQPVAPNGPAVLVLVLVLAFLMVSSVDYVSHKNRTLFRNQRPFETLVAAVLVLALAIVKIKTTLLPLLFLYLASGPVVTMVRARRCVRNPAPSSDPGGGDESETPGRHAAG
jgi:CDP-diacylglycerol--serine O-phosphatidyltransferase